MNKAIKLVQVCRLKIKPSAPFNFKATVFKPSHYLSSIVSYENEKLYHTLRIDHHLFGVVLSDSSQDKTSPEITVTIFAHPDMLVDVGTKEKIIKEVIFRYDMNGEISVFLKSFKNDPTLSGPIRRLNGMHPSCSYSLYEFLMITTMLQNTVVKRSIAMTEAMLNTFGTRVSFDGHEIYAIWEPYDIEAISEESLRQLRIGYRAKIIKRISESFIQGSINEMELRQMNREKVRNTILSLYGVGPQSVSYLLFEYFHMYDVLDHLSPWEGKILSMLLCGDKLNPPNETVAYLNKKYSPWSALAAHYLFEDVFWQRKKKTIPWLEEEIRD